MNSPELLKNLNEEQIKAITLKNESALILAGAGSGKTRVLTSRIAWLIHNQLTNPTGLLAVTFTNKAAKEMLMRVTNQLPIHTRGMWVGTFHGLCNRMLRIHHREVNLPEGFQILDSSDQLSAIKRLMKIMNIDTDTFPPKEIQYFINSNKDEGIRSKNTKTYDAHSKKINEIYSEYEKQCLKEGVVDFPELLLSCYELLEKNSNLKEHYQEKFKHILIDEFQDTSLLQYKWLKLLAGKNNYIFAVGDDDQSIYAFRGARVGNMQDLEKDFKIKKVIKLEQNYRSTNNILNAANSIIEKNTVRLGKNLWAASGDGELIQQYVGLSDFDEANFILDEVKILHRGGLDYKKIAILYRSNAQSRILEHSIVSNNIPYRVYGGLRFFERAEIKNALAYLRLISNKSDDNAFLRIVNFPTRGIGARAIEKLQDDAKKNNYSLWDAAKEIESQNENSKKGIPFFVNLIKSIEDEIQGYSIAESIETLIARSGLKDHYLKDKDGIDRISNLEELVSAAVTFIDTTEIENEALNLVEFLNYTSLESGELQASATDDALQLMTIHSSKGLEFDVVFITGLEDGLCPHEQSLSEDGLEEERRLMYVAVTRAKNKLYLSLAQSRMLHGQTRYNIPSRFLDEIPDQLIKRLNSMKQQDILTNPIQTDSYSSKQEIEIGSTVLHPKFGQGIVTSYEGSKDDLRIQIRFSEHGVKWLAMEFAKLTPI
ncbi:MAG: DNA helicase II [Nitrosomonadales bacterium]|nr:DNA helicase II [Nitrosomonadales bacterium]|tara:strand:+ start:908 stop:3046 length:2139 start_codon:yes stop_codon:yes gene_type:complete